jgi:hypothetical protein
LTQGITLAHSTARRRIDAASESGSSEERKSSENGKKRKFHLNAVSCLIKVG